MPGGRARPPARAPGRPPPRSGAPDVIELLQLPLFQRALAAGLLAGIAGGVVGSLVVARRMASISGGLAHAAFGGVGLGYLLGFDPLLGAALFAVGCALAVGAVQLRLGTGIETLIAVAWAGGMALGMLFVALAPGYAPDLMSYLFGSILLVPPGFLSAAALLDAAVVAGAILFYDELQAVSFDEDFARVAGVPASALHLGVLAAAALTVVLLIRIVGVILVIALVTVPAAIARHWTATLKGTMIVAAGLGVALCEAGLLLAYAAGAATGADVPAGPTIILAGIGAFAASAAVRALTARRRDRAAFPAGGRR
ncbi:MAG: metal ABC transporter permease [Acidobacteria bacterium]|nr:MAG: metal ABC transporter permease [Acidobacteriota bacterium]